MLLEMLNSWKNLELPSHTSVEFLIIENDVRESSQPIVETFKLQHPNLIVNYILEKNLGIPQARNTALEYAIQQGATHLAFMDDDGLADPSLLIELTSAIKETKAQLVGGPQLVSLKNTSNLSWMNRLILEGMNEYCNLSNSVPKQITLVPSLLTNNLLIDLSFIQERNIRFNNNYPAASDVIFSKDVREQNGKLYFAPKALVRQQLAKKRLSYLYQMNRAKRYYSLYSHWKLGKKDPKNILTAIKIIGRNSYLGSLLFLKSPISGSLALYLSAKNFGIALGYIEYLKGIKLERDTHYDGE